MVKEHRTPPPQPGSRHLTLENQWLKLYPGLGKCAQEFRNLGTPSITHSATNTTNRARPPSPESSGYVHFFWCLVSLGDAPSWRSRRVSKTAPMLCRWPTEIRATGSSHRPQLPACGHPVRRRLPFPCPSRARWWQPVLLPRGRTAQRAPRDNLFFPEYLPLHTLHDGGQRRRAGGHIGKCEETRGGAGANVCTRGAETAGRSILVGVVQSCHTGGPSPPTSSCVGLVRLQVLLKSWWGAVDSSPQEGMSSPESAK